MLRGTVFWHAPRVAKRAYVNVLLWNAFFYIWGWCDKEIVDSYCSFHNFSTLFKCNYCKLWYAYSMLSARAVLMIIHLGTMINKKYFASTIQKYIIAEKLRKIQYESTISLLHNPQISKKSFITAHVQTRTPQRAKAPCRASFFSS